MKKLGSFCNYCRQNKKNNKLDTNKIIKLETIFCWHWSKETKKDNNNSESKDEKLKKKLKNPKVQQNNSQEQKSDKVKT